MAKRSADPTTAADEARTEAEQARAEANRTTREIGKNSNGEPTIYPSDVESIATTHNLTFDEAERVLRGEDPDAIKGARVIYRQTYDKIPATPDSHPLSAADAARAAADEETRTAEATVDKTQPEAGPYGPYADYREPTVTAEEVASNSRLTVEEAAKVPGVSDGGKK